ASWGGAATRRGAVAGGWGRPWSARGFLWGRGSRPAGARGRFAAGTSPLSHVLAEPARLEEGAVSSEMLPTTLSDQPSRSPFPDIASRYRRAIQDPSQRRNCDVCIHHGSG